MPKKKRTRRKRSEPKEAPDWNPERFAGFWNLYPKKVDKQEAIKAWDALQPSNELIDKIALALKKQVKSEEWLRGIGIPYPSTYLNKRRWEDEVGRLAQSCGEQPVSERIVVETTEVAEW